MVPVAIGELRYADESLRAYGAYLQSVKSFTRWLWREGRIRADALAGLSKYNEETDRRHIVAGGASVKTAQELARHSTPVLTIGRYSHAQLHDIAGALDELPDLQPEEPKTERQALRATGTDSKLAADRQQWTGKAWRETARNDNKGGQDADGAEMPETVVFPGKSGKTQGNEREAPVGFEPTMADLQSAALATWPRRLRCVET